MASSEAATQTPRTCAGDPDTRELCRDEHSITAPRISSAVAALAPHFEASLCQGHVSEVGLGATGRAPGITGGGVVRLLLGPGSDLSEEPVFRMLSRSRWILCRSWVSSRAHL